MVKKKENLIGKQKRLTRGAEITAVAIGARKIDYIIIKLGN